MPATPTSHRFDALRPFLQEALPSFCGDPAPEVAAAAARTLPNVATACQQVAASGGIHAVRDFVVQHVLGALRTLLKSPVYEICASAVPAFLEIFPLWVHAVPEQLMELLQDAGHSERSLVRELSVDMLAGAVGSLVQSTWTQHSESVRAAAPRAGSLSVVEVASSPLSAPGSPAPGFTAGSSAAVALRMVATPQRADSMAGASALSPASSSKPAGYASPSKRRGTTRIGGTPGSAKAAHSMQDVSLERWLGVAAELHCALMEDEHDMVRSAACHADAVEGWTRWLLAQAAQPRGAAACAAFSCSDERAPFTSILGACGTEDEVNWDGDSVISVSSSENGLSGPNNQPNNADLADDVPQPLPFGYEGPGTAETLTANFWVWSDAEYVDEVLEVGKSAAWDRALVSQDRSLPASSLGPVALLMMLARACYSGCQLAQASAVASLPLLTPLLPAAVSRHVLVRIIAHTACEQHTDVMVAAVHAAGQLLVQLAPTCLPAAGNASGSSVPSASPGMHSLAGHMAALSSLDAIPGASSSSAEQAGHGQKATTEAQAASECLSLWQAGDMPLILMAILNLAARGTRITSERIQEIILGATSPPVPLARQLMPAVPPAPPPINQLQQPMSSQERAIVLISSGSCTDDEDDDSSASDSTATLSDEEQGEEAAAPSAGSSPHLIIDAELAAFSMQRPRASDPAPAAAESGTLSEQNPSDDDSDEQSGSDASTATMTSESDNDANSDDTDSTGTMSSSDSDTDSEDGEGTAPRTAPAPPQIVAPPAPPKPLSFELAGHAHRLQHVAAYCLPACALVLRQAGWRLAAADAAGLLGVERMLHALRTQTHGAVLCTFIAGLHEVAREVLPRMPATATHFVFALRQALHCPGCLPDAFLAAIAIQALPRVMQWLPVTQHAAAVQQLPYIVKATKPGMWRARHALAQELGTLALCMPPLLVAEQLLPLAIRLIQDSFAEVRLAAARSTALILCRLHAVLAGARAGLESPGSTALRDVLRTQSAALRDVANCERPYGQRVAFLRCAQLLNDNDAMRDAINSAFHCLKYEHSNAPANMVTVSAQGNMAMPADVRAAHSGRKVLLKSGLSDTLSTRQLSLRSPTAGVRITALPQSSPVSAPNVPDAVHCMTRAVSACQALQPVLTRTMLDAAPHVLYAYLRSGVEEILRDAGGTWTYLANCAAPLLPAPVVARYLPMISSEASRPAVRKSQKGKFMSRAKSFFGKMSRGSTAQGSSSRDSPAAAQQMPSSPAAVAIPAVTRSPKPERDLSHVEQPRALTPAERLALIQGAPIDRSAFTVAAEGEEIEFEPEEVDWDSRRDRRTRSVFARPTPPRPNLAAATPPASPDAAAVPPGTPDRAASPARDDTDQLASAVAAAEDSLEQGAGTAAREGTPGSQSRALLSPYSAKPSGRARAAVAGRRSSGGATIALRMASESARGGGDTSQAIVQALTMDPGVGATMEAAMDALVNRTVASSADSAAMRRGSHGAPAQGVPGSSSSDDTSTDTDDSDEEHAPQRRYSLEELKASAMRATAERYTA